MITLLIPIAFYGCFFFYPLINILLKGLSHEGKISLAPLSDLMGNSYYFEVFWFTIGQAALSTLLTVLLALPSAYIMAKYNFWAKQFLQTLISLPFMLPTVVVATAFQALVGYGGLTGLKGTVWIIIFAHVFYNFSLVTRIVGSFWTNLNTYYQEAAWVLGANYWQTGKRIILPLLLPVTLSVAALIFLFCFTSFGVILILGGGKISTIEVEIYRQAINFFHLDVAVILAMTQIIFIFIINLTYNFFQSKSYGWISIVSQRANQKNIEGKKEKVLISSYLAIVGLFLLMPLAALLIRSFLVCDERVGISCYQELWVNKAGSLFFISPWLAIKNSVFFAFSVSAIAMTLALLVFFTFIFNARVKKFIKQFLFLPLGTSSIILGLGYLTAIVFHRIGFSSSFLSIVVAHTVIAFPLILISVLPKLEKINPDILAAARVLGADERQVFLKIVVPVIKSALVVGGTYAFLVSMGEFGATLMISRPELVTIPLAIRRFLSQPGLINFGRALAMSVILMLVSIVGMTVIKIFSSFDAST